MNKKPKGLLLILIILVVFDWSGLHATQKPTDFITNYVSHKKLIRKKQQDSIIAALPADTSQHHRVVYLNEHFDAAYRTADFDYHEQKNDLSIIQRIILWIENLFRKLVGFQQKYDLTFEWYEYLLYACCGIVLVVALYFIVKLIVERRGRSLIQKSEKDFELDINNTQQLIKQADFEQLIFQFEQQGDTRQAIRLYYLWLLRWLNENEMINWEADKTNSDYRAEIKDQYIYNRFEYLSYLFNYIWYGDFSINAQEYSSAKKSFQEFLKVEVTHG